MVGKIQSFSLAHKLHPGVTSEAAAAIRFFPWGIGCWTTAPAALHNLVIYGRFDGDISADKVISESR